MAVYVIVGLCMATYACMTWACALAVTRAKVTKRDGAVCRRPVSIVICTTAHGEKIEHTAEALERQMEDGDELLIVADHASAEDLARLKHLEAPDGRTRVISNEGEKGKKHAQRRGVGASKNEVIICTDSDCEVSSAFVANVEGEASEGMTLLPVSMKSNGSIVGDMMEQEFTAMQVVTAGAALMGRPVMCNGAGMAFGKKLYDGHDSHTEYASGDDMFLLQHAIEVRADVRFAMNGDCMVTTACPEGVREYVRQRSRWLGKAGGYSMRDVKVCACAVLAGNVAWPMAFAFDWRAGAAVFAFKFAVDYFTLYAGRKIWRTNRNLAVSACVVAAYPVMIVVVGISALLRGKRAW